MGTSQPASRMLVVWITDSLVQIEGYFCFGSRKYVHVNDKKKIEDFSCFFVLKQRLTGQHDGCVVGFGVSSPFIFKALPCKLEFFQTSKHIFQLNCFFGCICLWTDDSSRFMLLIRYDHSICYELFITKFNLVDCNRTSIGFCHFDGVISSHISHHGILLQTQLN